MSVPLNIINIPAWLQNKCIENGFKSKTELHITVINEELADKIAANDVKEQVEDLTSRSTWTIIPGDKYLELAKYKDDIHRQSIIQLVSVPEIEHFYDELDKILGEKVDRIPPHITLFTKGYDRGIGVDNIDYLECYMVREIKS